MYLERGEDIGVGESGARQLARRRGGEGRGGGELLIARSPRNLSAHPDGARLDRSAEFQTEEGLE
jgi:hypothetical protein